MKRLSVRLFALLAVLASATITSCCSTEQKTEAVQTAPAAENEILIVTATMQIKADSVNRFKEIANELIARTRAEDGCITYNLLQDYNDPTIFTFYEEYTSDEAFAFHGKQPYLDTFRGHRKTLLEHNDITVNIYRGIKKN